MAKFQVYVSVSGGIAEAQVTRGTDEDVEIILIDWDNYEDNLPEIYAIEADVESAKSLSVDYPAIWFDLTEALTRAAGEDLEQYSDEDTVTIMDALEKAGHPWTLSEARQLPLDLT